MSPTNDYSTIARILGEELAKRVENKQRSGENNEKGSDFELRFAVFMVAKYADKPEASIARQVRELVDDLQLVFPKEESTKPTKLDFQIKKLIRGQVSFVKFKS